MAASSGRRNDSVIVIWRLMFCGDQNLLSNTSGGTLPPSTNSNALTIKSVISRAAVYSNNTIIPIYGDLNQRGRSSTSTRTGGCVHFDLLLCPIN